MWILYAFGTFVVKMSCYKIQPAKTLITKIKLYQGASQNMSMDNLFIERYF